MIADKEPVVQKYTTKKINIYVEANKEVFPTVPMNLHLIKLFQPQTQLLCRPMLCK